MRLPNYSIKQLFARRSLPSGAQSLLLDAFHYLQQQQLTLCSKCTSKCRFPMFTTGSDHHPAKTKRKAASSSSPFKLHLAALFSLAVFVAFYLLLVADLSHLTCTSPKGVQVTGSGDPSFSTASSQQTTRCEPTSQAANQSSSSSFTSHSPNSTPKSSESSPNPAGSSSLLTRHLPNCIIIGARKCGTRALLEFLDTHPRIRKVPDELHFFDDDARYALGLGWYRQQMPPSNAEGGDVVIEKTPAYFVTEAAPERLHAMNASIKIILIVRDPVTRLISDYAQLASNRAKKDRLVASFEEEILLPSGKINANYKGIRISLYAIYFARWIKLFPKRQLHVVDGDQFVYDPLAELAKVESFLGLEHAISREQLVYNTTKGFYCIRESLDETNKTGGGERCLNKNKGRKHPEIHPLVIRKLRKFYRPYNLYFYKLAGRRFAWPEY